MAGVKQQCQVESCEGTKYAKGLCSMHYRRAKRGHAALAKEATKAFIDTDRVRSPLDLPVRVKHTVTHGGKWGVIVPYPKYDGTEGCAGMDLDVFFPEENQHTDPAAVAACEGCPFVTECREWALASEEHGFFGGLSARQRSLVRKQRGQMMVNPPSAWQLGFAEWDWTRRLDEDAALARTGGPTQDEEHNWEAQSQRASAAAAARWEKYRATQLGGV